MYANKNNTSEIISDSSDNKEFIERSSLYQEFMAERNEILRHKWIESEKLGRDIGRHKAVFLWSRYHRKRWYTHMESLCATS